jgi:hypothetical protein
VERAIVREAAVGREKVTVWMPIDQVSGGRDGDDDAGSSVRADSRLLTYSATALGALVSLASPGTTWVSRF